jgi:NAD(P)-dependent dehydrogenase (short-subunit alcohol dehydrogenase family)
MPGTLSGKTFLVTGATEGIGKAAARHLASRGATVCLVGRNREKTERVVAELQAQTGNAHLDFLLADLSHLAQVRSVAEQFQARHARLEVLVNNAGGLFQARQLSADGHELTFALNHLSYFLLTVLLLDLLRKTPGARVVSTSSAAHALSRLDLATVATRERGYTAFGAYGDSKLANILFTRELARRLEGTGVTATCFHPGWVSTGFGLNNPGLLSRVMALTAPLFARSPEQGADTLIWLATSAQAAGLNGEYVADREIALPTRQARDPRLGAQLWALSERLCGLPASRAD